MERSKQRKKDSFGSFWIRTLISVIIIPLAVLVIHLGGWIYAAVITLLLFLAAWEYIRLLELVDIQAAAVPVLAGVILIPLARQMYRFGYSSSLFTILLLAIAAYHIFQYEQKETNPAADFGGSVSALFYVGFLGAYLISLRALPDGKWWTFLALPTVWIADSGAYLIGSAIGRTKLAPKTSPHKTWEGYVGGIIFGLLGGIGLLTLFNQVFNAGLDLTLGGAAALALVISALIPLGDLTESMIKRAAGRKDSGSIFPGHGGVFDRIDSLFWAAPIAYYLILHAFL